MLFGGKRIRNNVVKDALEYAEEKGFLIIYGAVIGSCSRGVQCLDSDYDVRFLYLDRKRKDREVFYPWVEKEETLHFRKYFDDAESPYECIALWEATSFFQFLKNPAFDGKRSLGLYNIVGQTMQSPYTWDPYGLSAKVVPLINSIFRKDCFIPHHAEQVQKFLTKKEFGTRDYIDALYGALCILYADQYHAFPPVYMKTLAAMLLENELLEGIMEMIGNAQKKVKESCFVNENGTVHARYDEGRLHHQKKYDSIIFRALEKAEEIEKSEIAEEMLDERIARIHRVVEESVYREQKVLGVMD